MILPHLTLHVGQDAVSRDGGDGVLVDLSHEGQGLSAGRFVAHGVEKSLRTAEAGLDVVLVEATILLESKTIQY